MRYSKILLPFGFCTALLSGLSYAAPSDAALPAQIQCPDGSSLTTSTVSHTADTLYTGTKDGVEVGAQLADHYDPKNIFFLGATVANDGGEKNHLDCYYFDKVTRHDFKLSSIRNDQYSSCQFVQGSVHSDFCIGTTARCTVTCAE